MDRNEGLVVLHQQDHKIDPAGIEQRIWQIARTMQRQHYAAYLVGGAVRDLLLNKQPKDFDLVSDATPNQIKRMFRNAFVIGRRFRLVHLRYGQDDNVEVATFRKEADSILEPEEGEARGKAKRVYGTPRDDAFRRDFSVNAMFYDLNKRQVLDYVGGYADLQKKRVRTVVDPVASLTEDPVRMLRAVRLAGRHQFTLDPHLRAAIVAQAGMLAPVSKARLLEEAGVLLNYRAAERSLLLAQELGLLTQLFPPWSETLADTRYAPLQRAAFAYTDAVTEPVSEGLAWALWLLPCLLRRLQVTIDEFYWDVQPQRVADEIQNSLPARVEFLPVTKAARGAARDILLLQTRLVGVRRAGSFGKLARRRTMAEALHFFDWYAAIGRRGAEAKADLAKRIPVSEQL